MKTLGAIASVSLTILSFQTSSFTQSPGQQQQPEFVKEGQQLVREGKPDDALALYRKTLQTSPASLPANIAAGSVLDLMGKGEEARKYFSKAIEVADTPEHKAGAQRAMAMSYAFEGNCQKTIHDHDAAIFTELRIEAFSFSPPLPIKTSTSRYRPAFLT
jgi:tetratricopeptide (TPR) repeat protein